MELAKCLQRKDGIKYLIIRKNSDIKKGDNLMIIKVNEEEVEKNVRRERS